MEQAGQKWRAVKREEGRHGEPVSRVDGGGFVEGEGGVG